MSSRAPRAFLIRSGSHGERDGFALEEGFAGGGFVDVGDLTNATTRDDVAAAVRAAYPDRASSRSFVANVTAQLWILRTQVAPGDLVVLPLKTTGQLAIGHATGPYRYRSEEPSPDRRHVVAVRWERTDVPRTAVHQDLLHPLGAFMTVCELTRHDAARRLEELARSGRDPGAGHSGAGGPARAMPVATDPGHAGAGGGVRPGADGDGAGFLVDLEPDGVPVDLEQAARDRIQGFISERFAGHGLAQLVAAVLRAEGFTCELSSPGPDGGVDIFAGGGPLGLDNPRLIVQVKSSPTPVESRVVRELHGVLSTHGADQALLVAWGGVNRTAQQELRNQFFRLRVWDANALLDAILRHYNSLPDAIRAELPLKQIWTLIEEESTEG